MRPIKAMGMNRMIVKFIALIIILGAVNKVRCGSITRKSNQEVLLLPSDVTNEVLEQDNTMKRLIDRIPARHLQCLTGNDSACTKYMGGIKRTLKKAMLEECLTCTNKEKATAGYVLASLIYYHPEEWRSMLQRYSAFDRYQQKYVFDQTPPTLLMGHKSTRHRRDFEHYTSSIPLPDSIPLRAKPVFRASVQVVESVPFSDTLF